MPGLVTKREFPDWMYCAVAAFIGCEGDPDPERLVDDLVEAHPAWAALLHPGQWGRIEADSRDVFVIVPAGDSGLTAGMWREAQMLAGGLACCVERVLVEPEDGGEPVLTYVFSMRPLIPV